MMEATSFPKSKGLLGPIEQGLDQPVAEFAYGALRRRFARFLDMEKATRETNDAEAVHQMRTSIRRIRSLLKLFEGHLPERLLAFREPFKEIADTLGEVRDLDVKLEKENRWKSREKRAKRMGISMIQESDERRRRRAKRQAEAMLSSLEYQRTVRQFAEILKSGPPPETRDPSPAAAEVLPDLLEKRYQKVLKQKKKLNRRPDAENYHRLRIECKKLRYSLECVSEAAEGADKKLRKRLQRIQDVLGEFNDAQVSRERIRRMIREAGAGLKIGGAGLKTLDKRYRQYSKKNLRQFPKAFEKIQDSSWKKTFRRVASNVRLPGRDRNQ